MIGLLALGELTSNIVPYYQNFSRRYMWSLPKCRARIPMVDSVRSGNCGGGRTRVRKLSGTPTPVSLHCCLFVSEH